MPVANPQGLLPARRSVVSERAIAGRVVVSGRAGRVIVNRSSGRFCLGLGLGTASDALRDPYALAGAGVALAAPTAAAPAHSETSGAIGPLAARLHGNADRAAGSHSSLHTRSAFAADDLTINDLHAVAHARFTSTAACHDDDAPCAIKGAAGEGRICNSQAREYQGGGEEAGTQLQAESAFAAAGLGRNHLLTRAEHV